MSKLIKVVNNILKCVVGKLERVNCSIGARKHKGLLDLFTEEIRQTDEKFCVIQTKLLMPVYLPKRFVYALQTGG